MTKLCDEINARCTVSQLKLFDLQFFRSTITSTPSTTKVTKVTAGKISKDNKEEEVRNMFLSCI